jgi:hypothetical protein
MIPNKIRKAIEETLGDGKTESYWEKLRECVVRRELVTVFDYRSTMEIDVAILKGLLKGTHVYLKRMHV